MYNKLITKVNALDNKIPSTSELVSRTQYHSEKQNLGKKIEDVDKKIPNTSKLVKKTDSNTTITEVKNIIPSITGLVATKAPTEKVTEIEN